MMNEIAPVVHGHAMQLIAELKRALAEYGDAAVAGNVRVERAS